MCYPCDRGIVLPICPGYTSPDPGMNPGAMIVRPSAASSHKFVAHPYERGVASVSKLRTRSEARDELTMSVAAAGNDTSP